MNPGRAGAVGLTSLLASIGIAQALDWGSAEAWHGTNAPNPDLQYVWKDARLIGGAVTDDHTLWDYAGAHIIARVNDWYNTTAVKPTNGSVADHASNRVHFHSERLGSFSGILGHAEVYSIEGYSSLTRCNYRLGGLTGDCNKTNHRATYADLNLNDELIGPGKQFGNAPNRNHTIGHEMGHIFALSHPMDYCGPPPTAPSSPEKEAIMRTTACSNPLFENVRGHDAYDIAILYP
jgi:hypothetical protein